MFLEINDKDKNDILIYSQNIFDPDENFRIIYKNALQKQHKKISYSDVCNFVHYPAQKNIIVYRILTNYNNIDASKSKYGNVLLVENKNELIYFDPILAIKDLPSLVSSFNLQSFRFKIQQIGIKTLSYIEDRENFALLYSYDLHAVEAQNQNDKIFADALFPEELLLPEENNSRAASPRIAPVESKPRIDIEIPERDNIIKEVQPEPDDILSKPSTENLQPKASNKFEQKELLKKVLGIEADLIENSQISISRGNLKKESDEYSQLFKTTDKTQKIEEREKDSIVLRMTMA